MSANNEPTMKYFNKKSFLFYQQYPTSGCSDVSCKDQQLNSNSSQTLYQQNTYYISEDIVELSSSACIKLLYICEKRPKSREILKRSNLYKRLLKGHEWS